MTESNCMFQYATRHKILVDTDLITLDEAMDLFKKNRVDFMHRLTYGEDPEMAVWINCESNTSYGETLHHWDYDLKIIDGRLYQPV